MKTKNIVYCAVFTALIAVSAFIRIPVPPVPFTAQTLFVLLAGLLLGAKKGSVSCIIYLVMGLIGIPVFTTGGGLSCLLQPTSGFLIGFIPGAFVTGLVIGCKKDFRHAFCAAITGSIVIYIIALTYAYILANFVTGQGLAIGTLLISYCAVFIPSDIAKAAIAAYAYVKLKKAGI